MRHLVRPVGFEPTNVPVTYQYRYHRFTLPTTYRQMQGVSTFKEKESQMESCIKKSCELCGKLFNASVREINRGNGKYCSCKCSARHANSMRYPVPGLSRSATRRRAREAYFQYFGLPSCQHCGKFPADVHHADEDPTNNSKDNLLCLCRSCHIAYHNHVSPKRKRKAA